jgi:Ca-activated chloride channel family protein
MFDSSIRQMNLRWAVMSMAVFWGVASVEAADREAAQHVRAAIKAYESGDYEKAQTEFTEAELKCPQCPEIAYNRGLASYRQRDFVAAREYFNSALQTRDVNLEAKTKYNLGNVAYSEALEKISDLKEAIELARSAIFHYRDALELDPHDLDARANIETAQLLIKDLLDKQKQEQEKQDQQDQQKNDQNQENQDQQDQEKQDQQDGEQGEKNEEQQKQEGEQDQEKKDQQEKKDGEKGDEKKDQQSEQEKDKQNQQQPNDQQQNPQDQQQQAGVPQERKLTDEELAKMLQAVRDKEAQRREENKQRVRIRQAPVQKDW